VGAAPLATLEILEVEGLGQRAIGAGKYLREQLITALREFEVVKEVHGLGLLVGIEFQAPRQLRLRIPYEAFGAVHGGMFGQILVMRLFRDSGFLTRICGNNFMLPNVAPPLVIEKTQMDAFVAAVRSVLELANSGFPVRSTGSRATGVPQLGYRVLS
jgi:ornithine--oxo-acid transaminase